MLLPPDMTFINADKIAEELTGKPGTTADINAGRILLDRLAEMLAEREDFAFETTLATRSLASNVREWREEGYQVHLVFLWLPGEDLAVQRVEGRVRDGGHDVPESTIRRRFVKGKENLFRLYMPIVDTWRLYDNSREADPELIAKGGDGCPVLVNRPEVWDQLAFENAS